MAKNNKKYKVGKSKIQGDGSFAKKNIKAGEYIGKVHTINKLYEDYDFTELGKKHNHSDNPNVENVLVGNERHLVAKKPIRKGQELTSDYTLQPDLEQPDSFEEQESGGWLDEYENGGQYLGTTNKGFNYSPAWGGAWQFGGILQPPMAGADQTVPMYNMGGSLPGSVGFTYARTKDIPSEGPYAKKTLPSAQKGAKAKPKNTYTKVRDKVLDIEGELQEKYIYPNVDKAYERAEREGLAEGMRDGPLDAIRHATSAASVSSAFPKWTNVIPGIGVAKFLGANVLGAAHELTAPNSWRERGSDLYNNFIGSVIGALPISDDEKIDMVISAQKRGILSNVSKPTVGRGLPQVTPKKENGGEMQFYQNGLDWTPRNISEHGSEIPMAQGGADVPYWMRKPGIVAESTSIKKPVVDKVLASGVERKKGETFNQAYDRKKKELEANKKRIYAQQKKAKEERDKKIVAERQAKIARSEENPLSGAGILNPSNWTRENWANTAIAEKMRFFPESSGGMGQIFDEYLNPLYMVGSMGDALASAPLRAKEQKSILPYISSIGAPLLFGRALGSGSINPASKQFWTGTVSNKEFANAVGMGVPGLLTPSTKWATELVKGSIAAGRLKNPEFVTALRTEAAGFNPSAVAPHPSLNPTQQTFTGSWVQAASKKNPGAFDEVLAYVSGPEAKSQGTMQLLSDVIPWSQAQKFAGRNLPFDAKTMSFGPGKYGTLENALAQGAINKREYVLLKNYNTQAQKIKQSANLSGALDETVTRLRQDPEMYNPNEILSPALASAIRNSPVAIGGSQVIAAEIENLKNAALKGHVTDPFLKGTKEVAKSVGRQNETTPVVEKKREGGRLGVNRVDEYPLTKIDNLLNFTNYNKPKAKNGWLDKYA